MPNQDTPEITLHDVISHIDSAKQVLKKDIGDIKKDITGMKQEIKGMKQDITGLKDAVSTLSGKVDDIATDVQIMKEDLHAFAKDTTKHTLIEIPHAKMRLDRLESHAKLSPLPEPVPQL